MFAGNLAPQFRAFGVQLVHELVHSLFEDRQFHIVGAGVDMQVPVAGVTEHLHLKGEVPLDLFDVQHEIGDGGNGDHHVTFIQQLVLFFDAFQEGGAGRPGLFQEHGGIGHQYVQGPGFQQHFGGFFHLFVQLLPVVGIQGHKQVGAHILAVHLFGEYALAHVLFRGFQDFFFEEFQGLGIQAGMFDGGYGTDAIGQFGEGHDQGHVAFGRCKQFQGQFGDDAQGAFAADDQVQQAVAGRGLGHGSTHVDDFPAGQYYGHGLYVIPGGTIFHSPHATGIGGHVAAQGGEFFTRIGGIEHAMVQSILAQGVQQHAGLYPYVHVLFVIAQDLVHFHGAQYQPPLYGSGSAGKARTGAPYGHRDVVGIAHLHDGGYFFRASYIDGCLRHSNAVDGHFIVGIVHIDIFASQDPAAGDGTEFLQDLRSDWLIVDHNCSFPFRL